MWRTCFRALLSGRTRLAASDPDWVQEADLVGFEGTSHVKGGRQIAKVRCVVTSF